MTAIAGNAEREESTTTVATVQRAPVPTWVWIVLGLLAAALIFVTGGLLVEAHDASTAPEGRLGIRHAADERAPHRRGNHQRRAQHLQQAVRVGRHFGADKASSAKSKQPKQSKQSSSSGQVP